MPVDPANLLGACKGKRRASERSSESSDQLLHMICKKKRSRPLKSLADQESISHGGGKEDKIPTKGSEVGEDHTPTPMESLLAAVDELRSRSPSHVPATTGGDNLPSHQPAEMGETSRLSGDELQDLLHRDLDHGLANYRQLDQLLGEILEAQGAAKEEMRRSEENMRALMVRKEELEIVVRAQRTKIAELFASLNKKDGELAEVCIASWASKERIWELEVDLKSKEHRLEQASAEAKELRGELAKLQNEASKETVHDLAAEYAEEAFSACVDLIKDRYPELDLSFCDLRAALEAQKQRKSLLH